jgi:hypothetical protein
VLVVVGTNECQQWGIKEKKRSYMMTANSKMKKKRRKEEGKGGR